MGSWKGSLFTPTKIQKLNNIYFINDMCHHRIIYSRNINLQIEKWNTIDYSFSGCHTIASDGNVYLVDNTGMNEVIVLGLDLKFKQKFTNIGVRPHNIIYDEITERFYCITANSQEISCFKNNSGVIEKLYTKKLDFLNDEYVRSIIIINGYMYFPSAKGHIYIANYIDNTFELINTYNIPEDFGGLNQVYKINDYYYITAIGNINFQQNPRILRTKDLSTFEKNIYEDIYGPIGFTDQPYFISEFDNKIWITEIGDDVSGIYSFNIDEESNIGDICLNYKFNAKSEDIKRKYMRPL